MPLARLSRVALNYERSGSGPAVVLSHGFADSLAFWDYQVTALMGAFTVIRYDHRGHGASSSGGTAFSIGDLADDLLRLLDELGVQQVALIGHSMGGRTAFQFAQRYPERLWALVPVGGQVAPPTGAYADAVVAMRRQLTAEGPSGLLEVFRQAGEVPARAASHPDWGSAYRARFLANRTQDLLWALDAVLSMTDLTDQLAGLRTPTLAMVGEHDLPLRASVASYAQQIPNCDVAVTPGVKHCPNVDAPEAFNATLLAFLRRHRPETKDWSKHVG